MSLFRVSTRGLIPFRLVPQDEGTQSDVTDVLMEALWSDLDSVTGMTLMRVQRGTTGDAAAPVIVALAADGNIVVVCAAARMNSAGLASCLEHVGWARGVTVSELASAYWRGSDEFWHDWQDFSGTTSPVKAEAVSRAPVLFLVTITITDSTEAALGFLADVGVPVRVLSAAIYTDDHGCQLLELGEKASSARPAMPASVEKRHEGPAADPAPIGATDHLADSSATERGYRDRQAAMAPPHAREAIEDVRSETPRRFVDTSLPAAIEDDRPVPQGREIHVGSMNRAVADELFSGSDPQRQQSRFARPTTRVPAATSPQSCSGSQHRRKQSAIEGVVNPTETDDAASQPHDPDAASVLPAHSGERLSQNSPQLAPLRFPNALVEPALPEELLGPMGSMTGNGSHNGAGNGRGSHGA